MTQLHFPADVLEKAKHIELLIMDVDGVLSDGKVYYSQAHDGSHGDEIKNFNIKDGLGIKLLQSNGIQTAIITGRRSSIVERRAKELGVQHIYQGHSDKRAAFADIQTKENLSASQIAHIGDDLPDLPLMQMSGLGIAVQDGNWFVKQNADWVTPSAGGSGAVRDAAELLLDSRGLLAKVYQGYLNA